jgi:hypothetical protein
VDFTDDFAGKTRAEKIALVQAAARAAGAEITEAEAARAIDLVTDLCRPEPTFIPWPGPWAWLDDWTPAGGRPRT